MSSLALAVRLFALALAAGMVSLMPPVPARSLWVVAGIATLAIAAIAQHAPSSRRRLGAPFWVLLHALGWTAAIVPTGGATSPLLAGLLLEVPLFGLTCGRAALLLSAVLTLALLPVLAAFIDPAPPPAPLVLWTILTPVAAGLSLRLLELRERRSALREAASRAWSERVEALATELEHWTPAPGSIRAEIDELGRIEWLDPGAATRLGIAGDAAIGRPWPEVLRLDGAGNRSLLESLAEGTASLERTARIELAGGATVEARLQVWPTTVGGRRRTCVRLDPGGGGEDPLRRLGEGAACIAHQVRNSVHALQGFRRAPDGAPADEDYAAALRSLGGLAEDVLAFSGMTPSRAERVPVPDAVRSARLLVGRGSIELGFPEQPALVWVHRGRLVHALFNLLDNAVRVSPAGRAVEVEVRGEGAWVVIEIRDFGPGLPPAVADSSGPVPSEQGCGLGLLAVRRFLEGCAGRLRIEPRAGGGTCCRIELPALTPAPEEALA